MTANKDLSPEQRGRALDSEVGREPWSTPRPVRSSVETNTALSPETRMSVLDHIFADQRLRRRPWSTPSLPPSAGVVENAALSPEARLRAIDNMPWR